ncbi:hypothetical protein C3L33_11330, partial [Rhododendron williamsianum]
MEKARADHFHLLPSLADMGSFPLIFSIVLSFSVLASCSTSTNFIIYPNFTASSVHFIDGSLGFLTSPNGTFKAAISSPGGQGGSGTNYYLCVVHVPSNTITWSANRDAPISTTGIMTLSATGIVVTDEDGNLKWSTPPLNSSVSSLQLTETGNLLLVHQSNATLWESFLYPTDTIVIGQNLPVGVFLSSAVSSTDLSVGSYSLSVTASGSVTASDALLLWQNSTYWKLSMDSAAYTLNSSYPVEYMAMNQSGLYLFGNNGSTVVMQVNVSVSKFGIAKLDYSGQFSVSSLTGTDLTPVLVRPDDKCQIPFICGTLGLCTDDANILVCSCPSNFHLISSQSQNSTICVPSDGTYSLSNSCNSTDNINMSKSSFSYLSLGYGIDYFANDFTGPVKSGVNLSVCEDLCSSECSCLGIFYDNSSDSCYVLQNQLGSVVSSSSNDRVGFVKAIVGPSPSNHSLGFPIVAIVLLPLIGFFLLAALGFFLWRRSKSSTTWKLNPNNQVDPSSDDLELDAFSIPGLPVRFGYDELEAATDKFKNMIGRRLVYFPMFALEMHEQGRYLELADPKLEGRVTSEDVEKLVCVALCCAHEDPTLRPNMVSVVSMLEGDIPLGEPKLESLNFLRFYGRRFAEASMIEENNGQDDLMFPRLNASSGSSRSSLLLNVSHMSSQQISGPR